MVSHNPFDPTIAPNAGSPYQARSAFGTLSNDLQKKQEEARSFHTVWKVCAIAIPFHLQDHVLVARSIYMGITRTRPSEGDSFGNRRDLKISIVSAIYALVPIRLPPGNE